MEKFNLRSVSDVLSDNEMKYVLGGYYMCYCTVGPGTWECYDSLEACKDYVWDYCNECGGYCG